MVCPNCKAEYREGFTECADCGVPLVELAQVPADRSDDSFLLRPTTSVWQGMDERDATRVQEGLLRIGIPAEIVRQGPMAFELRVPSWIATTAGATVSEIVASPVRTLSDKPDASDESTRECPLCWQDYRSPRRYCPNCVVALIDPEEADPAVMVWEGDHPGDAYTIHRALIASGIPFHITGSGRQFSHILFPRTPLQAHQYSLKVLAQDEASARRIVEGLPLVGFSELDVIPEDDAAEIEPFGPEEEQEPNWVLVWSGTDCEAMEALRFCFRENGIETQIAEPDGAHTQKQLLVPEPDEAQARTILRQILEGEVPHDLDSPAGTDVVESQE